MKRVILVFMAMVFLGVTVTWAAPFLVSPPTDQVIVAYEVELDGVVTSSVPEDLGNGTVRLHFDLYQYAKDVTHTVTARAMCDTEEWSNWSDPLFDFVIPSAYAGENFTLSVPKVMMGDATQIYVEEYRIVPGANQIIMQVVWRNAGGMTISTNNVILTGQAWTDVMGYVIKAGDVGKTLGPSLKQLIHNKAKAQLSVDW